MNIQESVVEINELSEKLLKCENDLENIEKEIGELLSIHQKKFDKKKQKKENKKKKEKSKK